MIFLAPLSAIMMFIVYQWARHTNGIFHSCDLPEKKLYGYLFILPVVHFLVAMLFTFAVNDFKHEYPAIGVFLIAVSIIYIVVCITVLNRKSIPVIIWVIYTVVMTVSCIIIMCYNFCSSLIPEYLEATKVLPYLFEEDFAIEDYFIQLLFTFVLILQYLYIRWIYFYYGLGSPFKQIAVDYAVTDSLREPVVKSEKKEQVIARSSMDLNTKTESLYEIKKMLDAGILTQEEYDIEKSKILNQ